jgi:hypothetical protein
MTSTIHLMLDTIRTALWNQSKRIDELTTLVASISATQHRDLHMMSILIDTLDTVVETLQEEPERHSATEVRADLV